jgi:mRNA interferase RelE/StbE
MCMAVWHVVFSPKAVKQLKSLDISAQKRIKQKLDYFCSLPNPQVYADALVDFEHGTYRYRIGDYRVIVDFDERGKLIIIAIVGHRREIYL